MFVPLSYNLRSLFVRRSATALTVLGIGATVAIVSGVLALQQGFHTMFTAGGRDDVVVFLRPGATNEGDSQFSRERGLTLIKRVPEIAVRVPKFDLIESMRGKPYEPQPVAAMEAYLAVLLSRAGGGRNLTNVPLRGVQPMTFEMRAGEIRMLEVEGDGFTPGTDELIVGSRLVGRIEHCAVGEEIVLNKTRFKVVGVFEHDGQFGGEIWGDLDRLLASMGRYGPNRVVAELVPGTNLGALDPAKVMFVDEPPDPEPGTLAARLKNDTEVPAKVWTEKQFLASQTVMLTFMLFGLGFLLAVIMGLAAVFTATNTMLSAIAARTHEIGILLAMGYRPIPIFLSFMFEALVLGLLGGIAGSLMALPFNGVRAGTMNFQTFTEMAFAFRVTPLVLVIAIVFSLGLGLFGGALPAWRAARLRPTVALRQG